MTLNRSFDDATGRTEYFRLLDEANLALLDPETGRVQSELVEWTPCPLCGKPDSYEHIFSKDGFDFVKCTCDMIYVNPRLKRQIGEQLYSHDDTFYSSWTKVLHSPQNQAWQIPYFEDALDLLQQFVKGGQLLEVGSSIGLFLEQATKRGFETTGLELERTAYDHSRRRGHNVCRMTLEEASFAANSFDAVAMFGVLEHLYDPLQVLAIVERILRPGGALIAIVPNVWSLLAMLMKESAKFFSGRNHLCYFSEKTLAMMMVAANLTPIKLDTCLAGLDAVVDAARPYRLGSGSTYSDDHLPDSIRGILLNGKERAAAERWICGHGLGLRLRVVARRKDRS